MDKQRQQEIAEGLVRGEREAWLGLYDEFAPRIWRHVSRVMGGDSGAVADVVQEVFMAAAGSAKGYDRRRGSLWMWLVGIARNHVALHRRRSGGGARSDTQNRIISLDAISGDLIDAGVEIPAEVLECRELAVVVREALTELPEEYQALLLSKYVDGENSGDIAVRMDCSAVAIRSKLARARRAFRRSFAKITQLASGRPEDQI